MSDRATSFGLDVAAVEPLPEMRAYIPDAVQVGTSSLVIVMAPEERAAALTRARAAAPSGSFSVRYVCHAWRGEQTSS